jgi:hypothetical protein
MSGSKQGRVTHGFIPVDRLCLNTRLCLKNQAPASNTAFASKSGVTFDRSQPNRARPAIWRQMFHLYSYNSERFMQSYHKRSNVESTFSMIKAKFGDSLRSKTKTAQINEALCKVLCHNICCLIQSIFELGIEPTFWVELNTES